MLPVIFINGNVGVNNWKPRVNVHQLFMTGSIDGAGN
jgi:hypothetical protein